MITLVSTGGMSSLKRTALTGILDMVLEDVTELCGTFVLEDLSV